MRRGVKGYSRAVYSVEWARQWKTAGFSSAEAKQCRLFDMKFEEALRWKHAGFTVQDAFQWKDSGFRTEEAAKKKDEGLTPVEAEEARHADAGQPGDEILSFHSDIVLHADSTLTVTENVEVQDRPGGEMQGYFKRVLAGRANLRHSEDSALTTAPSHTLLEVMKEGKAVNFSLKKDSWGDLTLCVDAREGSVEDSVHHFTIKYMTDCRLVEFHDHDELSFDVTGQYLKMPVKNASATVHLPKGADLVSADGYAGPRERKYFTAHIEEAETGDQVHYSVSMPLKNEMAFQVSVALTKGFARPGLMRTLAHFDRQVGHLLSSIAVFMVGLFFVTAYFMVIWRKVGKDPARGPIAPQVEPPESLSPAMTGYMKSGHT